MRNWMAAALVAGVVGAAAPVAHAAPTQEWASTVLGFSSQWSSGAWSAAQALGAPDTNGYGDIGSAWAPGPANGSLEFISLGFATPTFSTGALIRETYGNGFVYQVDAIDAQGGLHTVWTGTDPSQPGTPVDFSLSWAQTSFLTAGLKIYTDTNHNLGAWEEIDAVQLTGNTTAAVPEPEMMALYAAGLALLAAGRRRARKTRV